MEQTTTSPRGAEKGHHQNPLPQDISDDQRRINEAAHTAAERDMSNDAELTAHNANDDLDEGETARLGDDLAEII